VTNLSLDNIDSQESITQKLLSSSKRRKMIGRICASLSAF